MVLSGDNSVKQLIHPMYDQAAFAHKANYLVNNFD